MGIRVNMIAALMSPTRVKTGKTRVSYSHLLEPYGYSGEKKKYSSSIIIPKDDIETIRVIEEAINNAKKKGIDKFGKNFDNSRLHTPLHDGDIEKDDPAYKDSYYINASSKDKPQVIDMDGRNLTDPSDVYSGMWARFILDFYPYSVSGTGIAVSLGNVQKVEDGEPLGGTRSSALSDFGIENNDSSNDFFS